MAVLPVLDTGAQSAVVGKHAFAQLERALQARGLRLVPLDVIPTQQTRGIRGNAKVLPVQQIPLECAAHHAS
eukprot:5159335-Amphidinium_carterae.4